MRTLTILSMNPSPGPTILKDAGEWTEMEKILIELCRAELRCLDAHSHLDNLLFDHSPRDAIRHYEVGLRIGELSPTGQMNTGMIEKAIQFR